MSRGGYMRIEMKKLPKSPVIIEGFPGFGLVGTITTEFLIDHLDTELIGEFIYDELPATVAIHQGELVKPMAVHYSKKYNLIILHTILNTKTFEWKIAEAIINLAKKVKAKEIISIEGVGSSGENQDLNLYHFNNSKLEKFGAKPVQESIIMGVSAVMMLRYPKTTCIFAGTQSQLPDSKASAKVIALLDKYLKIKVDYKPLLKQAEEFEDKIKGILSQSNKTQEEVDKKSISYLG